MSAVPEFPTLHAQLGDSGSGVIRLPDGTVHSGAARSELLQLAAEYAEQLRRPVRLLAEDPAGVSFLAIHPNGTVEQVAERQPHTDDDQDGDQQHPLPPPQRQQPLTVLHSHPRPRGPAPPSIDRQREHVSDGQPADADGHDEPLSLRRNYVHPERQAWLSKHIARISHRLKDQEQIVEEQLERALSSRPIVTQPNYVTVASQKGGVLKTSTAIELGECIALRTKLRTIVVDLNPGGGALQGVAADDRQAQHNMVELVRDLDQIATHSHLEPYVSTLGRSGLHLLAVPPQAQYVRQVKAEHYEQLRPVLERHYNLIILDTAPSVTDPITGWALETGTQLVFCAEQGYTAGLVVVEGLKLLLDTPAAGENGDRATAVITRVLRDPRAGSVAELERTIRTRHKGPIIQIPYDLDLRALLDSGEYSIDKIRRRSTRLPIKQLAIEVCRRLI